MKPPTTSPPKTSKAKARGKSGPDGRSSKAPATAKAVRTRDRLVKAATSVFIDMGYLDARVADIVKAARVAHGTFYIYFDTKEDIFRYVADRVVDEMYDEVISKSTGSTPLERVHNANRRFLDQYEKHAEIMVLVEQVGTFNENFRQMRLNLHERFVGRLEGAVRRAYARQDGAVEPLNPRIVAHALGGMVDRFAYTWFVLETDFDREEALETLDAIWARTLGL